MKIKIFNPQNYGGNFKNPNECEAIKNPNGSQYCVYDRNGSTWFINQYDAQELKNQDDKNLSSSSLVGAFGQEMIKLEVTFK